MANEDLEDTYLEARGKFARLQRLEMVYAEKQRLSALLLDQRNQRREIEATARNIKIEMDSYSPYRNRWNNLQKQVYQHWLAMRAELTEVDRRIEMLQSQIREVDETALAREAADGKRSVPSNRRDILSVYPTAQRECRSAFETLKSKAEANASATDRRLDVVLRQTNAALNKSDQVDAQFGPPDAFFKFFLQYVKNSSSLGGGRSGGKTRR